MVMACTIAVLSTTGAPIVVLVEPPFPYFFLATMLTLSIMVSFCLKRARSRDQHQSANDDSFVNHWGAAGDSNSKGASLIHDSVALRHG